MYNNCAAYLNRNQDKMYTCLHINIIKNIRHLKLKYINLLTNSFCCLYDSLPPALFCSKLQ